MSTIARQGGLWGELGRQSRAELVREGGMSFEFDRGVGLQR